MGTPLFIVSENRRARFDFQFLQEFDAGIVLFGYEVKAAKAGRFDIAGSFVQIRDSSAYLIGSRISLLQPKNSPATYTERRDRQLLLSETEIKLLAGSLHTKGLTVVPISVFIKRGLVKVHIALAKPKKNFDKKDAIRQRDLDRDMARAASF
ncbi:MAG: hypothetical protein RIQ54_256 [Candidatus Parcubacteria bacterium]|jgi:SsrA-binding protein